MHTLRISMMAINKNDQFIEWKPNMMVSGTQMPIYNQQIKYIMRYVLEVHQNRQIKCIMKPKWIINKYNQLVTQVLLYHFIIAQFMLLFHKLFLQIWDYYQMSYYYQYQPNMIYIFLQFIIQYLGYQKYNNSFQIQSMKFVLVLLTILLLTANAVLSYDTSVNYISNPDFSIPQLASGEFDSFTTAGAWSEITNQIEIGDAKIWNKRWPSGQLCDLSSNHLSIIYQIIQLNVGYYQLSITWAANQIAQFNDSKWSLYWNDILIKSFVGTDYEIHKETLTVKAIKGANNLTLKGQSNSQDYGAGIKLVELFAQILSYDNSVNYVSNPDFSIPKLTGDFLIGQSAGAWSEVNNIIEIGKGTNYNSRWDPSSQICELAADSPSNIYQSINLDAGYYQLKITWAGKQNHSFVTSQWSVYWNDVLVKFIIPVDYEIHKQTLNVVAKQGANKLSLRGQGTNEFGAGIKMVQLYAENNIQNGNFETPSTRKGWKILKSAGQWSSYTNQIKIGQGTIFNSVWTTGQVAELDANQNSLIYQSVEIQADKYHLKFDWAARKNVPYKSNSFSVWWNNVRIALIKPPDYLIHTFNTNVQASQGKNTLSLTGQGISDGYGVGVDNIKLWRAIDLIIQIKL